MALKHCPSHICLDTLASEREGVRERGLGGYRKGEVRGRRCVCVSVCACVCLCVCVLLGVVCVVVCMCNVLYTHPPKKNPPHPLCPPVLNYPPPPPTQNCCN